MRPIYAKSILITTLLLGATLSQAHVETGSFLNKRAYSVAQLMNQTRNDAQVRDRYERHFRMSDDELIQYFSRLHVGKLHRTGAYVVYNCRDDEVIRARVFHLKA